jgi:CHAT domain-containing protein
LRANLGALRYSEEKYAEAQEFLQQALAIHEKILGHNHPAVERDLQNLAMVYYSQRMYGDAIPLLNRNLQLLQSQFEEQFTYQTEGDRLQFLHSVGFGIPLYFSVCFNRWRQDPTLVGNMYDAALWEKGLIANSMAAVRAKITASGDKEAQALFEQLSTLRTQLAGLRNPPKNGLEEWQNNAEQLRRKSAEVETNLVRRSGTLAEERKLARATWQDVRNALKPGEAAIEFVRFDYHDGKQWTQNGYYVALVLTPEATTGPYFVPLGEARHLESDPLQDYWKLVAEVPAEGAGMQFYRAFWKPVEARLAGHRRVYISGDGVLNAVSFAVVPAEDGRLLLDRFDIRDVFTTKDLLRPAGHSAENSAVLVGNPRFDLEAIHPIAKLASDESSPAPPVAEIGHDAIPSSPRNSECPDLPPGGVLCPLKGTETEVRNIFALLKQANWDAKPPYTQESARKEVIQKLQHPRLLHVATHGFFSPERVYKRPDLASDWPTPIEDPMLRSGLMFAGADGALKGEALPNGSDNGVLTASEAATLDLQGTELVVLSACETGRGRIENNGEGVFGLQRALQEAGSESVLMSMWKAPDLETRDLMTLFYQKWLSGEDKYDALRDAQIKMRDAVRARWDGEDRPYYWGAFVLIGR